MPPIDVLFYEDKNGHVPVIDFLKSLNRKMEAKVTWTISKLAELGYELREPYSKPLGDGIFELRTQLGGDISRVLYFFMVNGRAVLTHGYIKKLRKLLNQKLNVLNATEMILSEGSYKKWQYISAITLTNA